MLARMSHPMHTYLLGREKNQSIRSSADTHTNKQDTGKRGARLPITGLISASEPENTHRKPTANRWTYVGLQPEHTQGWLRHKGLKKEKGARRDQLNLLPTYFIWYEDQGDVVPLRRDKGLA